VDPFATFLYRTRHFWVVLLLAVTAALLFHLKDLRLDNTLEAWFPKNDQDYITYQEFQKDFSGNRNLIIAIEAEDIFRPDVLDFISEKTEAVEAIDLVTRVYSLATAVRVVGESEAIEVNPLLHGSHDGHLPEIIEYTLSNEMFRDDLVSADSRLTTMIITFDEGKADRERSTLLGAIREIIEEGIPDGVEVSYSGSMEISKEYDRFTMQNQRDFTPPLVLLIWISTLLLFRSFWKVLIVSIVVTMSLIWTMGIYAMMGYSFNVISGMLTPLIGFLSISDTVHIFEYFDEVSRRHASRKKQFISTISYITYPCLATSLTTSFGLLSLTISRVPAVKTFGLGASIGIMSAFVISIVIVPFLLSVLPARYGTFKESILLRPLRIIHSCNLRNPRLIFLVMTCLFLIAVINSSRLDVNTNQMEFFSEDSGIRRTTERLDEKLSGVFSVEIYLRGRAGLLKTPDVLERMERLSEKLLTHPHVKKTLSLADQVKLINRELHRGDPLEYRIPEDPELIAQELFLFSLSRQGREDLYNFTSSDYSRGRMSIKMQMVSSDDLVVLCHEFEAEARKTFAGSGMTPTLTGVGQLFSSLDRYLVQSQIRSFSLAFVTVIIFMFVSFRSWKYGMFSILPNLFPIIIVMGIMGFLGITLNVATIMVASVALGIATDDTIHFIWRLKRERREKGQSQTKALENTTLHSGRAIVSTSLINTLGFSILIFADFVPTSYFGMLVALTMMFALVGDLIYLPASLLTFWIRKESAKHP